MTSTPNLDAALVAAQAEARSLKRDGKNQHGGYKYATADQVADLGRQLLTKHGLAWSRISTGLQAPTLRLADIGNQDYVGDVVIGWKLRHGATGEQEFGTGTYPIITSKQRPHEKATAASVTYGCGQIIQGVLCWDREDEKHAVDRRGDGEPVAPTKPAEPIISEAMAKECRSRVEWIAAKAGAIPGEVWAHFCEKAKIEPLDDGGPPRSIELTLDEGHRVLTLLGVEIKRLEGPGREREREREPGDDGDEEVPEDDAAALNDAARRVSGQFAGTTASKPKGRAKA